MHGKLVFAEDCRAWIHDPFYPEAYDLFRDFKYNPNDDVHFTLLEGMEDALTNDEKWVINLVVNTFGMYGDGIPSSKLLAKERIMKCYITVKCKYSIDTEEGKRTYIHGMLDKVSWSKATKSNP